MSVQTWALTDIFRATLLPLVLDQAELQYVPLPQMMFCSESERSGNSEQHSLTSGAALVTKRVASTLSSDEGHSPPRQSCPHKSRTMTQFTSRGLLPKSGQPSADGRVETILMPTTCRPAGIGIVRAAAANDEHASGTVDRTCPSSCTTLGLDITTAVDTGATEIGASALQAAAHTSSLALHAREATNQIPPSGPGLGRHAVLVSDSINSNGDQPNVVSTRAEWDSRDAMVGQPEAELSGFTDMCKTLSDAVRVKTGQRATGDQEAVEVAPLASQPGEKESMKPRVAEGEVARCLQAISSALDRERSERVLSDADMRVQVTNLRQNLDVETKERAVEISALRNGMQTLELQAGQHINKLGLALKAATGRCSSGEEPVEKCCNQIRSALDMESKGLGQTVEGQDAGLRSLQLGLQHEACSRSEDTQTATALLRLPDSAEAEGAERARKAARLPEQLKLLSDTLELETLECRSNGQEAQLPFQEVSVALDGQHTNRELLDGHTCAQVETLQEELARVRSGCVEEISVLRQGFEGLEAWAMQQLKGLRPGLDAASTAVQQLEGQLSDLRRNFEAKQVKIIATSTDLSERVSALSEGVDFEAKGHAVGDEESARVLQQWEGRERRVVDEQAMRRIQDLGIAIEKERGERDLGHSGIRTQLANCWQELTAERETRADEDTGLRRSLQSIQGHIAQQLKAFQLSLEWESDERKAMDERFQKQVVELRSAIDEGPNGRASALKQLHDELGIETTDRIKALFDLSKRLESLSDELHVEATQCATRDNTASRISLPSGQMAEQEVLQGRTMEEDMPCRIEELHVALKQERTDRDVGDSSDPSGLASCREDIVTERLERAEETATLCRALQIVEGRTSQRLKDFRDGLELDANERGSGSESLRILCRDIQAAIDRKASSRAERSEEDEWTVDMLRHTLEVEGNHRAADINILRRLLQAAAKDRVAGDETLTKSLANAFCHSCAAHEFLQSHLLAKVTSHRASDETSVRKHGADTEQIQKVRSTAHDVEARKHMTVAEVDADARKNAFDDLAHAHKQGDEAMVDRLGGEVRRLESSLADVRSALEAEVRARVAAGAKGEEAAARSMAAEARRVDIALADVHEALEVEAQARAIGDLAESESWKRAVQDEESLRKSEDDAALRSVSAKMRQLEAALGPLRDELGCLGTDMRILKGTMTEDRQALEDESSARKAADKRFMEACAKLTAAVESECKDRFAMLSRLEDQMRKLQNAADDCMGHASNVATEARASLTICETQLQDLSTAFRLELESQDTRIRTADSAIDTLKNGLSREAEARDAGDMKLQLALEALDLEEFHSVLSRRRSARQAEDDQLRDPVSFGWHEEVRKLWEAIDSHTHDINVDSTVDTTRQLSKVSECDCMPVRALPGDIVFNLRRAGSVSKK